MFDKEEKEGLNFLGKWHILVIAGLLGVVLIFGTITFIGNRSVQVVDTGLVRYQEFQEIYGTCSAIQNKICTLAAVPDTDKMFTDFSKAQQLANQKMVLARWVNEYNAKSKLINFSLWKSKELPYQLQESQFNCQ